MCEHNRLQRIIVGETSNWKCEDCKELFVLQPFVIGVDYGTRETASAPESELRIIEKRISRGEWAVVRMYDLQSGDQFRFQDKPEEKWLAFGDPYTIDAEGNKATLRSATGEDPLIWAINAEGPIGHQVLPVLKETK